MTGFKGLRGDVHAYLCKWPATTIHHSEIARALGITEQQATSAVNGLREYPHSGVSMPRKGFARYDPIAVTNRQPVHPASSDAMAGERAAARGLTAIPEVEPTTPPKSDESDDDADVGLAEMRGELFEIVDRDQSSGLFIVRDSLGLRRFLLVRISLFRQMQKQLDDAAQVEAFKRALRSLVREP